nr:MAG TPA: hypothetical protein [Bacteriophage sp.]
MIFPEYVFKILIYSSQILLPITYYPISLNYSYIC